MAGMTKIVEANDIYGQLKEGLHITGYSFARACTHLEHLLANGLWRQCAPGFKDVNTFLDSLRDFAELRAAAEQRKRLARRIKELQPRASNRQIAKTLGVGRSTVNRDVGPNGPPPAKNSNENNHAKHTTGPNEPPTLSGAEVVRLAQRQEAKAESADRAEQRRQDSRSTPPLPDGMDLRIGDCREVLADIADNSVALILTDPPYPAEAEPLYRWLAEWAARVLIPGGSLICYTGQSRLNSRRFTPSSMMIPPAGPSFASDKR
jgi:hypothetical protein